MAEKIECLDENYSTTRLLHKLVPEGMRDKNGKLKKECKFSIDNSILNIHRSILPDKPEDRFEPGLYLCDGEGRRGEGGLRTQGYFKHSYKKNGDKWYLVDRNKLLAEEIDLPQIDSKFEELPLISIVTVVYNGEKYLEETIQSVIDQTYPNVEYIIVDGGSTDGTSEIIKKYEEYIDYWISETDSGIYDAMNKGLSLCSGDLIGIINADDFYERKVFEKVVEAYGEGRADVIYGDMRLIGANRSEVIKAHQTGLKYGIRPYSLSWIWVKMLFAHPSSFVSRSAYCHFGGYDTDLKIAADYEFFIRLVMQKANFKYIPITLSHFREGGISSLDFRRVRWENFLARKKHSIVKAYGIEMLLRVLKWWKK